MCYNVIDLCKFVQVWFRFNENMTLLAEVGPDPVYRSRLREDSAFFFRTRIRSQKFVKNRTRIRSHFSISAVAGACAVNS